MLKKNLLTMLLLVNFGIIQADGGWASFLGAFLGALFGSNSSQPNESITIVHVPAQTAILDKCACGATAAQYKMIRLGCCGAVICDSCWKSRLQTALRSGCYPKCHACGKTFNRDIQNVEPSAPLVQEYSNQLNTNNYIMCASGCHSKSDIKFKCGHGMCKSCLRSRVAKSCKEARGDQPYVTCPTCHDMLTLDIIRQV